MRVTCGEAAPRIALCLSGLRLLLIHVRNLSGPLVHDGAMMLSIRHVLSGVLIATAALAAGQASADKREHDHDAVRLAVEKGEIRPLAEILVNIRGKLPGEIVGVEVERKDGRWIYEFRVVDSKGKLFEAYVDGKSGEIERVKEK